MHGSTYKSAVLVLTALAACTVSHPHPDASDSQIRDFDRSKRPQPNRPRPQALRPGNSQFRSSDSQIRDFDRSKRPQPNRPRPQALRPGNSQFRSISNPVEQNVGFPQTSFNQFQQQNNEQSQISTFLSQNEVQQSSEGESVFVGQSLGEPRNNNLVSISQPSFVSVSQPELLLSSFSSSPNQDVGGVSLIPMVPKVKTADQSTLPLGDSSSLSSSFPPFPNNFQQQQPQQRSTNGGGGK